MLVVVLANFNSRRSCSTFGKATRKAGAAARSRRNRSLYSCLKTAGLDEGILACLDASSGELKWKGGRYGHGQLLLAGGHLVITTEDGDLVLVDPTPDGHREIGHVPALDGETWNVPALAGGILLIRNTKEMAAYDLRPDPE